MKPVLKIDLHLATPADRQTQIEWLGQFARQLTTAEDETGMDAALKLVWAAMRIAHETDPQMGVAALALHFSAIRTYHTALPNYSPLIQ